MFPPDNFYADFEDLVQKLVWSIQEIETVRQYKFRHCVEQYSWDNMAPEYDRLFDAI